MVNIGSHLENTVAAANAAVADLSERISALPLGAARSELMEEREALRDASGRAHDAYDAAWSHHDRLSPKTLSQLPDGTIEVSVSNPMGGGSSRRVSPGCPGYAAVKQQYDREQLLNRLIGEGAYAVWGCAPCPVRIDYYGDTARVYADGQRFLVAEHANDPARVSLRRAAPSFGDHVRAALAGAGVVTEEFRFEGYATDTVETVVLARVGGRLYRILWVENPIVIG